MRFDQSIEVPLSDFHSKLDTLMNQNIVKEYVKDAVKQHANGKWVEIEGISQSFWKDEKGYRRYTENNSEQIISLESSFPRFVMRLMPNPQEAVHYVFVRKPGYTFHKKERTNDDECVDYDF